MSKQDRATRLQQGIRKAEEEAKAAYLDWHKNRYRTFDNESIKRTDNVNRTGDNLIEAYRKLWRMNNP